MVIKAGQSQVPVDLEGEALVKGLGQFTDDMAPDDALWGAFLRSPIAHGRITKLDASAARKAAGVVAVLTSEELKDAGIKPAPFSPPIPKITRDGMVSYEVTPRPALAVGKVRHVGEPVALVIARSLHEAQDAAELIELDIEPLKVHTALAESASGEDPVWDFSPDNRGFEWEGGDAEATEAALCDADHVISVALRNQRIAASPMEPRSVVATHDNRSGQYTLYCCNQGTTIIRQGLAGPLGVPPENIRVIAKNVGGGFGVRAYSYPEYVAIAGAAKITNKTVRWTSTRSEAMLSDQHGRASELKISGGFDAEGKLMALKAETWSDLGAYIVGIAAWVQSIVIAEGLVGAYTTPNLLVRSQGYLSNTGPVGPYRGAGRPETTLMLEQLMDKAANELGIGRDEIRRRNLIPASQIPYKGPLGLTYDSGDFPAVFEAGLESADWKGFEMRREEAKSRGKLRGIGCVMFLEWSGPFFEGEPVSLKVNNEGTVDILTPAVSNGQRHISTFAHMASQKLEIDVERINIVAGDSAIVPEGPPSVGSRTAMMTGSAVITVVDEAIERGRIIVSQIAKGRPNDVTYADGHYKVSGSGQSFAFLDLPGLVDDHNASGGDVTETLDGMSVFKSPGYTFPNGAHFCEVEVDPETGEIEIISYCAVDDAGTVLNPPVVEGQIMGGIAQGLGQAMMEDLLYNEDGQVVTGTFMDYAMPRADDMPESITLKDHPVPATTNPVGAKGVGEAGTTGSVATILSAVGDALRPAGVEDIQMPLSPSRVWQALQDAGG